MAPVQGLDRAGAPPAATAKKMLDAIGGRWWNVYIGGPYSGGSGWGPATVREYVRHGIDRFMLTYVGQQDGGPTPGLRGGKLTRDQGRADAQEALRIAKGYGYSGDFPLCLDIEIHTFNKSPQKTVAYARAWCATVREAGARPGVYANPVPLAAMAKGKVGADFVWIASWVTTTKSARDPHQAKGMPAGLWARAGQRAWQYAGGDPCVVLGMGVDINVADLGCLAPPPGGVVATPAHERKRVRALRRGDRGPLVTRATHRLSVLRSRKTGTPYLDGPRSRFDAETEAALKRFQAEHGLAASGRYGRESARALLNAVKRAQLVHKNGGAVEKDGGAAKKNGGAGGKPGSGLPALVREFQRLDAATDRAWQKVEAYGRARARALDAARRKEDDESHLDEIAASLAGIERQLAILVDIERRELELETAEAAAQAAAAEADEPAEASAASTAAAPYSATAEAAEAGAALATAEASPMGTSGPNGAGATIDAPPRSPADFSDAELDARIDLLERRLDQSRKLRIARYARAEKALVELTGTLPSKTRHVRKPPRERDEKRPKHPKRDRPQSRPGVKALQRLLNRFTEKYLDGLPALEVDGKKGSETDKRIGTVKYYLGYGGTERRSTAVPEAFLRRLRHPRSPRFSGTAMLARAAARRRKQRRAAKRLAVGPIEGTPKHIIDRIALPIAQGCGINRTVADNDAANARHGPTNTGGVSDHQGPGNVAWAADISNGGSPTPEMDKLARALAKRFNIPWSGSGLVNATHGGYRYQLIYRTMQGGNHFNHVHFGVRDV